MVADSLFEIFVIFKTIYFEDSKERGRNKFHASSL
jgi:hypothetical protein